jgi:hypothetical protein
MKTRVTSADIRRAGLRSSETLALADLVIACGWTRRAVAAMAGCSTRYVARAIVEHYPTWHHLQNFHLPIESRLTAVDASISSPARAVE